ncbi:MAG: MerR family transcriptional regulator, partial [Lachnospiraceae bacterium]|nr:MerR family transcriptional regulator [Lachnospiraceae bacterium]
MNRTYTIGELAELAGVSTKTLRVYERKGLLLPERNTENRYRIYTDHAVRKLEQIRLMKYLGFSLDQIELFLAGH